MTAAASAPILEEGSMNMVVQGWQGYFKGLRVKGVRSLSRSVDSNIGRVL